MGMQQLHPSAWAETLSPPGTSLDSSRQAKGSLGLELLEVAAPLLISLNTKQIINGE